MANRILRDWTDSENVHKLSCEAERFFTRLIMKADDFGRYLGNYKLLRSTLFPLHDSVSDSNIEKWLTECVTSGLVFRYEVEGKNYIEIKRFDQKGLKVRRSKYPPSSESDRFELIMGYVYVIGVSLNKPVKIGFSMNPWARLKEITANHPENLEILISFKAEKRTESLIHMELKTKKIKNEWFNLGDKEIHALQAISRGEIETNDLLTVLRSSYEPLRLTTLPETKGNEEETKRKETESNTKADIATEIFMKMLMEDDYMKQEISMNARKEVTNETIEGFQRHLNIEGKKHDSYKDYRSHFRNWLNKKPEPKNESPEIRKTYKPL